jgi:hypothetical protein
MDFVHVLKAFIDKGHTADRAREDYGYDLIATTFDEDGCEEDGDIRVQIKATDRFDRLKSNDVIVLEIEVKHYHLWNRARMPVFLVAYDAQQRRAYWLYVQAYFAEDPRRRPRPGAKTVSVRVPLANEFTEASVDYMRARKTAILAQQGEVDHHG